MRVEMKKHFFKNNTQEILNKTIQIFKKSVAGSIHYTMKNGYNHPFTKD